MRFNCLGFGKVLDAVIGANSVPEIPGPGHLLHSAPITAAVGLSGHQQVADAYLFGLVRHKKGKLGTMDRSLAELLPDKRMEKNLVLLI